MLESINSTLYRAMIRLSQIDDDLTRMADSTRDLIRRLTDRTDQVRRFGVTDPYDVCYDCDTWSPTDPYHCLAYDDGSAVCQSCICRGKVADQEAIDQNADYLSDLRANGDADALPLSTDPAEYDRPDADLLASSDPDDGLYWVCDADGYPIGYDPDQEADPDEWADLDLLTDFGQYHDLSDVTDADLIDAARSDLDLFFALLAVRESRAWSIGYSTGYDHAFDVYAPDSAGQPLDWVRLSDALSDGSVLHDMYWVYDPDSQTGYIESEVCLCDLYPLWSNGALWIRSVYMSYEQQIDPDADLTRIYVARVKYPEASDLPDGSDGSV